jgi:uncharacterized protein YeaO (DUF488 family)
MLRQASVPDLTAGRVSRRDGLVVVAMRTYPRPVKKEARDEYLIDLSPDAGLFRDFKDAERRLGDHDRAFAEVDYENRFTLSGSAMIELERLARAAGERDVFLVCQCAVGQRCHRELLLLTARHAFDAEAETPRHAYPTYMARLAAAPPTEGRRPSRYP